MGAVAAIHLVADLALGILHDKTALRPLDKNDRHDHRNDHGDEKENDGSRDCALAAEFERSGDSMWKLGDDARQERTSGVEGKSVSVRVDLGGGRIIKKKKNKKR